MRRKKAPASQSVASTSVPSLSAQSTSPPKRQRTALSNWHSHATEVWAHAEWFLSLVDAPFFTYPEFNRIMESAMGLHSLVGHASRIQLARVRAAMCNAFPGRYAKPRRLSKAFMAAELEELEMYRTDARLVMRGHNLPNAIDPATGTALPHYWTSRYCCPAPDTPLRQTPIFVRTTSPPPTTPSSSSSAPYSQLPSYSSCPTSCLATISTMSNGMDKKEISKAKSSSNSTNFNSSSSSSSPHPSKPHRELLSSLQPLQQQHSSRPNRPGRVYIRPAVFISLHEDSEVIVQFTDDNSEQVVHDLDVMLVQPDVTPSNHNLNVPSSQADVPTTSPSSLPTRIQRGTSNLSNAVAVSIPDQSHSPLSPRQLFSPQPSLPSQSFMNDPTLYMDTPRMTLSAAGADGDPSVPFPTPSPFRQFHSPLRPIRPSSPQTVECEVDVHQLAEGICLLDRKTELLYHLRSLNDQVEKSRAANESISETISHRYDSIMTELAVVEDDLRHVLATQVPINPVSDGVVNSLNFNSPQHDGGGSNHHVSHKDRLGHEPEQIQNENEDINANATHSRELDHYNLHQNINSSVKVSNCLRTANEKSLDIPPQHLARNVNFRNADGAASLAKVLTRAALARLPDTDYLKRSPTAIRADLMECVSACVTVLLRARITNDYRSIEEVVGAVPLRFPENAEALEAIHSAARMFSSWPDAV